VIGLSITSRGGKMQTLQVEVAVKRILQLQEYNGLKPICAW
jgi:hypothetical protein